MKASKGDKWYTLPLTNTQQKDSLCSSDLKVLNEKLRKPTDSPMKTKESNLSIQGKNCQDEDKGVQSVDSRKDCQGWL